jgi:hypothetical protein
VEFVERHAWISSHNPRNLAANTAGCMRAAVATATDQATEMFEAVKERLAYDSRISSGLVAKRERGKASALCSVWFGTRH